jgi:uracil-DNA glycosylase family protein
MVNDESLYYDLAVPPNSSNLGKVAEAALGCKACHLWKNSTQTVFGEGPHHAKVMLIGEAPGDQEDQQGHPFVGPAGQLLKKSIAEAGLDPKDIYTTNAVKHFKWEPRGSRRLHKRPNFREIQACYPWLEKEIELVEPEIIVCLGSTAGQAIFGRDFKVTEQRGSFQPGPYRRTFFVTVHPSSILRARDSESRDKQMAQFVADLKLVTDFLSKPVPARVKLL